LWHYPDEQLRYILPFFIFLLLGIGHAGENWGLGALYHKHRHKRWEKGWEIKLVDGLPQYEQKRSSEQMRDEVQRLMRALAAGRGFAWEWSARTGQVEMSGSIGAIYDLDLSLPPRELLWKYVHPEDAERVRTEFESGFTSGRGCQVEYRIVHPNGNVYWLSTAATLTNDAKGEPMGLVGFTRDITERKAADNAVHSSEKVASVCQFAGTITNEIKEPLDKAIGLVESIHEVPSDPERTRRQVKRAEEDLKRISDIAANSLSLYRESFDPSPVNVPGLLDGLLESYASSMKYENVRIRKRYEYRGDIESFPGEMRELFSNLVQNALEAVEDGGTVTLHTKLRRDPRDPAQSSVLVYIADDGLGIKPEERQKLFSPFFTTKGRERSGLGLWIARGLAQKHGGDVRWRSSTRPQRRGSCFAVFLPIKVVPRPMDVAPES
jgi:signal transduction histidine kinase